MIRSAQKRTGAKISVVSARYTSAELRSATDATWAETDGVVFTSGAADGSGSRVTIDPDLFDDPAARRTTH